MRKGQPTTEVELGGRVVGRIVQLASREFMARMADGTRCGFHGSVKSARETILRRAAEQVAQVRAPRRTGIDAGRA